MKSIEFLYVALAAFFLIQGTYLAILIRDYVSLSKQSKELGKTK